MRCIHRHHTPACGFLDEGSLSALLVPGGGILVRGMNAALSVGKYTTSNVLQNPADPHHRGTGGHS